VNSGFGYFAEVSVSPGQVRELQLNLVRSRAAGTGEGLPAEVVRALLLLRANIMARGTSGDLAPLAHLALVLIGEGEAAVGDPVVVAELVDLALDVEADVSLRRLAAEAAVAINRADPRVVLRRLAGATDDYIQALGERGLELQ
jgi:histidine ammonia-lyase